MARFWIGLVALLAVTAIGSAPTDAQGQSGNNGKPAIFGQGGGQGNSGGQGGGGGRDIGLGNAKSGVPGGILSGGTNLPPGLAKRQSLPPGLAKMDRLPPGLARGHSTPPGLAKMVHPPPGLSK